MSRKKRIPWNKGLTKETDNRLSHWNKGLTKETDPRVRHMAESRKGSVPWNKGKKTGQIVWNKGLTKETDIRVKHRSGSGNNMWKGGPTQIKCEICSSKFLVYPSRIKTARFCSVKCMIVWRSRTIRGTNHPLYNRQDVACSTCGKLFSKTANLIFRNNYCSRSCYAESLKGHLPKGFKDQIPWSRGLAGTGDPRIMKNRRRGKDHPMFGKLGSDNPNYKGPATMKCIQCKNIVEIPRHRAKAQRFCSPECYRNWLRAGNSPQKGKSRPPNVVRNSLRRRTPSRLEEKFSAIIKKYSLPYRYVGNGAFFIEQFNPDFINTDHEKIAVEVYAKFHKELGGRTEAGWKRKRSRIFRKYGWSVVYFEAKEVNEQRVLSKLK